MIEFEHSKKKYSLGAEDYLNDIPKKFAEVKKVMQKSHSLSPTNAARILKQEYQDGKLGPIKVLEKISEKIFEMEEAGTKDDSSKYQMELKALKVKLKEANKLITNMRLDYLKEII